MNKKPESGATRTKRYTDKFKTVGLRQIKVWVADEQGIESDIKTEADKVRDYAAKQPLTKALMDMVG